ncbi:MAG: hypothetical protein J1F18_14410 [Lachnospiraceae bacterium]|nr:hypothetical protein [Lachnospiraceae bacterium]
MKKRIVGFVSLCVLLIAFLTFRYPLFELHGMKQFPLYLLILGISVITVSGIIKSYRIVPIFTTIGYIVGFFVGQLAVTSYDPGGGTLNNMWQIWLISYTTAIVAGVLIEIFNGKNHKKQ